LTPTDPSGPKAGVAAPRRSSTSAPAAFLLASLASIVLAAFVAWGRPILAGRWSLLAMLGAWAALWLVAVAAAFRTPKRLAVAVILAAGVALRLAALAGPPTTSDDLYRYAWDGRVQAAGIDPYLSPPSATRLASLREPWLWPDAEGCARLDRAPGCTRINRADAPTIYPPLAETWFSAVSRIAGIGARHKAWQVAGLVTELATMGLLGFALRRWGRDPRWLALYALSPAPVLEVVNNGHVDGLAVLLLVAALAVVAPGPDSRAPVRDVATGLLIGAAALVKLYPAIALVGLVGARRLWRARALWRAAGASVALMIVAYAPHVARVGAKVLGYLPGYLGEEHYRGGTRYLIAGAFHTPAGMAGAVSATAVVVAVSWAWWRCWPAADAVALALGALLLAASPVQPWYALALLAVATVAARPAWAAVTLAGYPYFFAVILASSHAAGVGQVSYLIALAAVAAVGMAGRGRRAAARPLGAHEALAASAGS